MKALRISGREYPVTGWDEVKGVGTVPRVEIPMMSDIKWQLIALRQRLAEREKFAAIEDVDKAIRDLRKWLLARGVSCEEVSPA